MLLYALAEDGRIDEAEELWTKLFSDNLESMPRIFFDRMIAIYYRREMHDKMFEVFHLSLFQCESVSKENITERVSTTSCILYLVTNAAPCLLVTTLF